MGRFDVNVKKEGGRWKITLKRDAITPYYYIILEHSGAAVDDAGVEIDELPKDLVWLDFRRFSPKKSDLEFKIANEFSKLFIISFRPGGGGRELEHGDEFFASKMPWWAWKIKVLSGSLPQGG